MANDKILKFWRQMGQSIVAMSNEDIGKSSTSFAEFMPSGGTIGYIFPVSSDVKPQGDHHIS